MCVNAMKKEVKNLKVDSWNYGREMCQEGYVYTLYLYILIYVTMYRFKIHAYVHVYMTTHRKTIFFWSNIERQYGIGIRKEKDYDDDKKGREVILLGWPINSFQGFIHVFTTDGPT